MPALILLAFIAVPIVEIALLIEVGGRIGVWPTLAVVVATAVFGTWMLRLQGLSTLRRAQASLANNQFPANEVFDGLCLVFAGALLLTPGFVTDAVGLLLMAPPVRALLRTRATGWLQAQDRVHMTGMGGPPASDRDTGRGRNGTVIEGEYEELEPDPPDPPDPPKPSRPSPWNSRDHR
jgi:UPF0716 protein FxsA